VTCRACTAAVFALRFNLPHFLRRESPLWQYRQKNARAANIKRIRRAKTRHEAAEFESAKYAVRSNGEKPSRATVD
jgi:hypothetical protein